MIFQMQIREATADDYPAVEKLVIDSFEPITWYRKLDRKHGPLNNLDWRARWQIRMQKAFDEQMVLLGEQDRTLLAVSTSALDDHAAIAYIDILAVARAQQRKGLGREMLGATMHRLKELGMQSVHLDCLTDNDKANALYESEGFEEVARHIRWFRKL